MKPLNPNDFGKNKLTVEDCWGIDIKNFLTSYRQKIKEEFLSYQAEISGLKIEFMTSRTNFNGLRYWFKCPICKLKVGRIYKHPLSNLIGCRKCLNLDYRKRRFKGMIEEQI